jgi:hypothetical protein
MQGSVFAHRREDELLLSPSYPLLPTRQRLWERVLATTDATGTGVQLRSQLRLAFDAVRKSKDAPLGHIVGGDFIYDEIRMRLRQSSQISAETANAIDKLDGANDDKSRLKARALKAVFLLTRITNNSAQDTGLHTDSQSIADLLVDDLSGHSGALRGEVSTVLNELVDKDRLLMRFRWWPGRVSPADQGKCRLVLVPAWREDALRSDPSIYESKIREQLMQLAGEQVRKLAIPQGQAVKFGASSFTLIRSQHPRLKVMCRSGFDPISTEHKPRKFWPMRHVPGSIRPLCSLMWPCRARMNWFAPSLHVKRPNEPWSLW